MERLRYYARETRTYWREAGTVKDFLRLMRVRLSQSKIGPLVCPRPVTVDVDLETLGSAVRLRSHTTDISVLGELLVSDNYSHAASALDDESISRIVDLGANTGLTARWLLERFPSARVVSVEPEPENVDVLRRNLAPYGDRARLIPACVGARERRVSLDTSGGHFAVKMRELDGPASSGDARVVTMQAVLTELGGDSIDLLKCDIEGAERELFESDPDWVDGVRVMSVECHGSFSADELLQLLRRRRRGVEVLHRTAAPEFDVETITLRLGSVAP